MRHILVLLSVILFLSACSIQSRKYRPGYHVELLSKSNEKPQLSKQAISAKQNSQEKLVETSTSLESITDSEIKKEALRIEDQKSNRDHQLIAKNAFKSPKKGNIVTKTIKKIKTIPNQQKEKLMQQIQLAKSSANYPSDLFLGGGGFIDILYAFIGAMVAFTIMYLLIFFIIIILFA
jgi:hypothetical protein